MATPSLATPLLSPSSTSSSSSSVTPQRPQTPDSPIAPLASPPDLLSEHPNYSHNNSNNQQYRYETRYFEQQLDHFSFADLPTFRQRYLINTEYWAGPARMGPIFFYCGNEGEIQWFAANTGFVWEIAPRFGAMVVFPEHRYYGESMPYGSIDEAYKNATTLAHLTAEQALADFAILITDLKKNLSAEACPVVLFGGSYGGMLAAWMRLKYPHIAIGALASSAPVLQFEDIVPPETFYDIVSNSFRRESTSCFNTIRESWDILESEGQKNDGLLQLTKTFRFMSPDLIKINDRKLGSIDDLYNWLESAYSYLAMVNYPYPANFMMPLPGDPIKEVCRKIDNCPNGTSILDRLFAGVSVYYNYTGEFDCFQLDDDPHGLDGWNWQACTEMVMPMSTKQDSMFPASDYNYTSYQLDCWNSFRVKPRPKWITTEFGGHVSDYVRKLCICKEDGEWVISSCIVMWLEAVGDDSSMILVSLVCLRSVWEEKGKVGAVFVCVMCFVYLVSSWLPGGCKSFDRAIESLPDSLWNVLDDVSDTIVALVTEKGAHHLDLRAVTAEDPDWLLEQRKSEIKLIRGWLHDYYDKKQAFFAM
ncbi:serine carboxypeptidase S28 family protein [Actinidia rufa]|uniref:Serine carboxypeptidase S28 family protein n=1 Tax=Actinidia rufa TaxID=165716 RepID=A0A7J0EJN5_9ERIC|nr:serine carboxypeptidase S28 family protein [Actinidia rufa]